MRDLGILLTDLTFFNQLCGIFDHFKPIISLSQCLCCQGPGSDMVATDTFMHLSKHVISVFPSYALKDGCRKASFVKGPPMNGESSRPRLELGGLLWIAWQYSVHQVIPDGVYPQLDSDITGDTSSSSTFTEGFGRFSIGTSLSRSSHDVVASFARASAREFSALGTCLTWTCMNFLNSSRTFLR